MIGGHAEIRASLTAWSGIFCGERTTWGGVFYVVDYLENGLEHSDNGAVRPVDATWGGAFYVGKPAQAVEMTEEFVRAVNKMNYHTASE